MEKTKYLLFAQWFWQTVSNMFSCDADDGIYELEVPLDPNGKITLFGFCDGKAPFKQILTPQEAADFDICMVSAPPDSPEMTLTPIIGKPFNNWITISGTVKDENETPLCAMVLANGQHMFSCAGMANIT